MCIKKTGCNQPPKNCNVDKPASPKCNKPNKNVAASEYGYLTGDPHLKGGDGELYDFNGNPGTSYSILKDKNLDYKAKIDLVDPWGNKGVVESSIELAGKFRTSTVSFNKDGKAVLVNERKGVKTETVIQRGKTYRLADGATVSFGQALGGGQDGKQLEERLIVTTREGYIITQVVRNGSYIDSNIETGKKGVYSDGVMPSGLIGDTFDTGSDKRIASDDQGTGVLNKPLSFYS